jgi:ABC-2 type transport system ATP-binding protein
MAPILEVKRLTSCYRNQWTYRRVLVLRDLSFSLDEGEIFGLVGPNGAGKTTTFKLLVGLLRPTQGVIRFRGKPITTAARTSMGFLPEQPYFYDHLTVEEAINFYGALYGIPARVRRQRVTELIERLELEPKRRARLSTLSKGMLQRVGIGQAIVNSPSLLILDEPMSGLDPIGRRHLRDLILDLRSKGTTVIFSSHILPDAEILCDRVAILHLGTLREIIDLRHEAQPDTYMLVVRQVPADVLSRLRGIASQPLDSMGSSCSIRLPDLDAVRAALDLIQGTSGTIESLSCRRSSLEERFLATVGRVGSLD